MELEKGNHWIKLDQKNNKLVELTYLLVQAEVFVNQHAPNTIKSDYWGLTNSPVCNKWLNDIGHGLPISYNDVLDYIPRLKIVMEDLNLFPYIGRNIVSNWGIHRHHAGSKIHRNMCIMGKGNNNGTLNFYGPIEPIPYSKIPVNDHIDKSTLIESVSVCEGDIFSIDTWVWHSHITPEKGRVETFLLHFNSDK
jgi:hypothetical protein